MSSRTAPVSAALLRASGTSAQGLRNAGRELISSTSYASEITGETRRRSGCHALDRSQSAIYETSSSHCTRRWSGDSEVSPADNPLQDPPRQSHTVGNSTDQLRAGWVLVSSLAAAMISPEATRSVCFCSFSRAIALFLSRVRGHSFLSSQGSGSWKLCAGSWLQTGHDCRCPSI